MIAENDEISYNKFEWPIHAWPQGLASCDGEPEEEGGYTTQGSDEDTDEHEEDIVSVDKSLSLVFYGCIKSK